MKNGNAEKESADHLYFTNKSSNKRHPLEEKLTYASILLSHVQEFAVTCAVIATKSVFAVTFWALTCFLLLAFINICNYEIIELENNAKGPNK
jgi:hypothetical protein